jgi:MarR family transcriptional regulator, organic hydroperoxide resistance regulator
MADEVVGRPDLAAMFVQVGRALMAAEQPVLRAHDLTMWAYVVLLRLGETPVRTQNALARDIGADKTRIIGVLDDLQSRGLIRRWPAPDDRRVHLLALTDEGRRLRDSAQTAIQTSEQRVLALLPPADRAPFLRALVTLAALPRDRLVPPDT